MKMKKKNVNTLCKAVTNDQKLEKTTTAVKKKQKKANTYIHDSYRESHTKHQISTPNKVCNKTKIKITFGAIKKLLENLAFT